MFKNLLILALLLFAIHFSNSSDPASLKCNFKDFINFDYLQDREYTCVLVENFPFIDPSTITIEGTHNPEDTKDHSHITAFHSLDLKIYQIPNLLSTFTALKIISIKNSPLRYLKSSDLAVYKDNLVHLGVTGSNIEIIESTLFDQFTVIVTIDLQGNKLFSIDVTSLKTLTTFKNFFLDGNECSDITPTNCKDADACDMTGFFTLIEASICKAVVLDKLIEKYQTTKLELDLSIYKISSENDQKVTELNKNIATLTTNLANSQAEITACNTAKGTIQSEVNILKSKISSMESAIENLESQSEKCIEVNGTCRFTNSGTFEYSCIAHNINVTDTDQTVEWTGTHDPAASTNLMVNSLLIRDLNVNYVPNGISISFPNLKYLVIRNCGLKKFANDDFSGLSKLESIQFASNEISTIETEAFNGLNTLIDLDLSQNKIKSLPSRTFVLLTSLKSLNLDKNQLTSLKSDIVPTTNKIEKFFAAGNGLTLVESNFVYRLRNAKIIDFSGNRCNLKYDKEDGDNLIEFYNLILRNC